MSVKELNLFICKTTSFTFYPENDKKFIYSSVALIELIVLKNKLLDNLNTTQVFFRNCWKRILKNFEKISRKKTVKVFDFEKK